MCQTLPPFVGTQVHKPLMLGSPHTTAFEGHDVNNGALKERPSIGLSLLWYVPKGGGQHVKPSIQMSAPRWSWRSGDEDTGEYCDHRHRSLGTAVVCRDRKPGWREHVRWERLSSYQADMLATVSSFGDTVGGLDAAFEAIEEVTEPGTADWLRTPELRGFLMAMGGYLR